MTPQPRYMLQGRNGYYAIDRYDGNACLANEAILRDRRDAEILTGALNNAVYEGVKRGVALAQHRDLVEGMTGDEIDPRHDIRTCPDCGVLLSMGLDIEPKLGSRQ